MPTILCEHCRGVLPETLFNAPEGGACPRCRTALFLRVFPAFYRGPVVGQAAEAISSDEDASCFYHPRKKAVVPCAECGRFLCALCDLDIDGRHLCPTCVAGGPAPDASRANAPVPGRIEGRRVLHDNIAFALATIPFLIWPFTLVTAPVALALAIRYWNEPPRNPLGRSRVWLVLTVLIALATIAGWVAIFYFLTQFRSTSVYRP